MRKAIKIYPEDNVAVALEPLKRDETALQIQLKADIPQGHKFALSSIQKGEPVVKYGFPIGIATTEIKAGDWIHSHNLSTSLGVDENYIYKPIECQPSNIKEDIYFDGYLRDNGKVGIRNELWIIPTVGCINSQALNIAEEVKKRFNNSNIDDITAFTHNYGCSQLGGDHENTKRAILALARHPNAGGVLILGLGCENNQISELKKELGECDSKRIRFLTAQECQDEIQTGVKICMDLLHKMQEDQKEKIHISKLVVGVKCGGSDGLSGITANPLVGKFTDWLVSHGGTTIMTEVPEMFGAEKILMNRCINKETFDKTVNLINGFKDYFRAHNQPIYENPSPGNKAGGITTLEEKSLGCVQKGGKAPVTDVLEYAQSSSKPGLNLLWSPGNDLVASTSLALSGCHLVLFTTGRGTPFGTCVPTLKVSTNAQLSSNKPNWIDFDASQILTQDPESIFISFVSKILQTVNGSYSKNEISHSKEIAIFKSGVTL